MTKKAIYLSIILFLLLALLGLSRFVRLPFFRIHPHEAVPAHTAMFFTLNKKELAQWEPRQAVLAEVFVPKNLREDFKLFLEILAEGEEKIVPADRCIQICVQPSQHLGSDLLFVLPDARRIQLEAIATKNGWSARTFNFKNQKIWTLQKGENALSFTKYHNLLIFARHAYLVENAVSQLKHPASSVCRDKAFRAVYKRAVTDDPGMSLFVNVANFNAQFAPLLNAGKFSELKKIDHAGQWLFWKIPLEKQVSRARGAFFPSTVNRLTLAARTAGGQLEEGFLQAVPDNLSAFAALHTGDVNNLLTEEEQQSSQENWAGGAVFWGIGELLQKGRYEQFLLLPVTDGKSAENMLEKWSAGAAADYQFFKIWPLRSRLLEEWAGTEIRFGAAMGDFVLFGNNLPGIERWLGKYIAGQTLSKDPVFLKMKMNLPADQDGLLYLDGLKGWQVIAPFLNEKVYLSLDRNPLPFSAALVSLVWEGEIGRLDLTVSGQVAETGKAANILWSVPLLGKAVSKPFASVDPASGEMDVLVLDEGHRLYLISRNGRVLWQRALQEPVLSDFFQIDINNEKAGQFAFSTRNQIHVINRKGEDLDGYPLELQVPAANGVTVVDFFQSHDYRFFIVCENGKAYGFDEKGSPVEGWRPKEGVGDVKYPILHFQTDGKDFLALLGKNGTMQVFKKNGERRFSSISFAQQDLQPLDYQVTKSSSRIVTADPNGKVYVTNLAGDHFGLQLRAGENKDVRFVFSDVTGDERKDYIAMSGDELSVSYYNGHSFLTAFQHQFPWPQDEVFPVHWQRHRKDFIGTVNRSKKQVFLLDGNGKVPGQFPLAGSTPFTMIDLAGDGKPVIVTGNGAAVTAYLLE